MARKVFKISKESETIEVKYNTKETFEDLKGTSEYGFTPEIVVEDYEVDEADGAIQHQQTTWNGKFDFKTMGYKGDEFQSFLVEVAEGIKRGDENSVSIKKVNHINGKTYTYEDCIISDVTVVNGKVNELCAVSWTAQTNGYPIEEEAQG